MKCPLRNTTTHFPDEQVGIDTWDCLQDKCAWWYKENNACGILTIAQGATYLHKALVALDSKMPFRRHI